MLWQVWWLSIMKKVEQPETTGAPIWIPSILENNNNSTATTAADMPAAAAATNSSGYRKRPDSGKEET
jgi:hypothetical protein